MPRPRNPVPTYLRHKSSGQALVVVPTADGTRKTLTAEELGVTFDPVPTHVRGIGSYGSDEIPRPERPTPVPVPGGGPRRRRRRGGRRRGGRQGDNPA